MIDGARRSGGQDLAKRGIDLNENALDIAIQMRAALAGQGPWKTEMSVVTQDQGMRERTVSSREHAIAEMKGDLRDHAARETRKIDHENESDRDNTAKGIHHHELGPLFTREMIVQYPQSGSGGMRLQHIDAIRMMIDQRAIAGGTKMTDIHVPKMIDTHAAERKSLLPEKSRLRRETSS
jgi:hypothetical protein